jgi:putative PIN family toxin of toxin-antitoxin system
VVGAALTRDGIPRQALLKARREDVIAVSPSVVAEIHDVLARPKFVHVLSTEDRAVVLGLLMDAAVWVRPTVPISDCRDAKDNQYLELALAASADVIISSDNDLLVLDPWRGIRIMRPADYLAMG